MIVLDLLLGRLCVDVICASAQLATLYSNKYKGIRSGSQITQLTTRYSYNANGQLQQMTYPSGAVVGYQYDNNGKLIALTLNGQSLLSNISWSALGHVSSWSWSNGATYQRTFDQDGRITGFSEDGSSKALGYDAVGNITSRGAALYSYDAINRLVAANDEAFTQSWSYDANGNRTSQGNGQSTALYSIDSTSNRLLAVGSSTYQYDANGSLIADSTNSYQYDAIGRLISVNNGATAQYHYNAEGQRVYKWSPVTGGANPDLNGDGVIDELDLHQLQSYIKSGNAPASADLNGDGVVDNHDTPCIATRINGRTNGNSQTAVGCLPIASPVKLFAYEGYKLLGEYGPTGIAVQETVWLGNLPVATLNNGQVYNIYPDQIGAPHVITDSSNHEVWRWDNDPFGTTAANEDPTASGSKFTYNLRFPGQYYDAETGKHYNYFRDYDPSTGRYVESDLIGLKGGMNTYAYVGVNPLINQDILGLMNGCLGPFCSSDVGGPAGTLSPSVSPPGLKYEYPQKPANSSLSPPTPLPDCFKTLTCQDEPLQLNPPQNPAPPAVPVNPTPEQLPLIHSWDWINAPVNNMSGLQNCPTKYE